jgi:rhodanese-related sulfurtransferase
MDQRAGSDGKWVRDALGIVLAGVVLGGLYNWLGLEGKPAWGLPWIAEDRVASLEALESVTAVEAAAAPEPLGGNLNDPLAIPAEAAGPALPEVPAVGRPVQIEVGAVKQLFDAGAALIVDAREAVEFAEGHIPGSISLPYDLAVTDPVLLESLEAGGRPIVTYCGGGTCEQSLSLAHELVFAGHERVAVFMGGYPDWVAAGYPVATGEGE